MAPALANNQQLSFECPGCGARITVTTEWLKAHEHLACHTCPAVLTSSDLLAAATEVHQRRRRQGVPPAPVLKVKLSL